jgi:hypothetical protein
MRSSAPQPVRVFMMMVRCVFFVSCVSVCVTEDIAEKSSKPGMRKNITVAMKKVGLLILPTCCMLT